MVQERGEGESGKEALEEPGERGRGEEALSKLGDLLSLLSAEQRWSHRWK